MQMDCMEQSLPMLRRAKNDILSFLRYRCLTTRQAIRGMIAMDGGNTGNAGAIASASTKSRSHYIHVLIFS
jgi:hypothetical protein